MYFVDIIFIFILAAALSYIFVGPLGWRRREAEQVWSAVLFVLPLLFFAFWAANLWIEPVGPVVWGVAFFPVFIVGLITVLVIAAAAPPKPRGVIVVEPEESHEARKAAADAALGFFFWLVLIILIGSVVFAYIFD